MLQYSTTAQIKNKGVSMNKTKGSGAEAPIHKEPPGAGPYSQAQRTTIQKEPTNEQNQQNSYITVTSIV